MKQTSLCILLVIACSVAGIPALPVCTKELQQFNDCYYNDFVPCTDAPKVCSFEMRSCAVCGQNAKCKQGVILKGYAKAMIDAGYMGIVVQISLFSMQCNKSGSYDATCIQDRIIAVNSIISTITITDQLFDEFKVCFKQLDTCKQGAQTPLDACVGIMIQCATKSTAPKSFKLELEKSTIGSELETYLTCKDDGGSTCDKTPFEQMIPASCSTKTVSQ